jgi:hypothetical protein
MASWPVKGSLCLPWWSDSPQGFDARETEKMTVNECEPHSGVKRTGVNRRIDDKGSQANKIQRGVNEILCEMPRFRLGYWEIYRT